MSKIMRKHLKFHAKQLVEQHGIMNLTLEELCVKAKIQPTYFKAITGCSFSEYVTNLQNENDYNISYDTDKRRVTPVLREKQILLAAVELAQEYGYQNIQRQKIGALLKISPGLINAYFDDMETLREKVLQYAIENNNLKIIAQAVIAKDPQVYDLSSKTKRAAILSFVKN